MATCRPSRYRRDNDDLLARLKRIEGQVRGVQKMIEDDRYCVDILIQLAAVRAALDGVSELLLKAHIRGCVADALDAGTGERVVEELVDVVSRFLR